MSNTTKLKLKDGTEAADTTNYRQLMGSLQYLLLTGPNIAFSVNKLSLYMHSPSTNHWAALKRVLRYLKGSVHH